MIKTILAIADPKMQHTAALRVARDLARRSEAKLHLVLPCHDPLIERTADLVAPEVAQLAREQFEGQRRQWLAGEASVMADDGLDVEHDVIWAAEPHEAIIALCLALQPDLVIKDAPPPETKARMTTVERKLIRLCPAPLLLVRSGAEVLPRRLLAAVDTSPADVAASSFNDDIVKAALSFAFAVDAEVHLAHSFPFERRATVTSPSLRKIYDDICDDDARSFAAFANRHQVPEDRRHWMSGAPERRLPALIEHQKIDLLVLGTTYRSGLDRFLIGSTCERFLKAPPCDMLVVKPEAFAAELGKHVDLDRVRRLHDVAGDARTEVRPPPAGRSTVIGRHGIV